ncbi:MULTISPECIES: SDR family NAD(P)-dependent oxidoreductase [unclassified Rhizobium]|uniref:SDR family NAD(P)-dependent oxidoreductase n=1 Tax=Rhizobium sp. BK456 TaxID=2587007 RepID=UPI00160B5F4D|nr:NAD(P)-dependent dehydrogenase (short-subunit alcohol dehydrogenase family) [Rhizobium sp. BK456]
MSSLFLNNVVAVTGAGSGIGRAIAHGATVHLADRDPNGLAQTADLIRLQRGWVYTTQLDVSSELQIVLPSRLQGLRRLKPFPTREFLVPACRKRRSTPHWK